MMYLTEDELGRLDIGPTDPLTENPCGPYVVSNWTIGFPAVRAVSRARALADGTVDDTRFVGARSVTVSIRVDQRAGDPQLLIDALMPYLNPRRRPRLAWTIPGSTEVRSIVVRGQDAPVEIAGPKFHTIVAQWVGPGGLIESGGEVAQCQSINPASDTEDGREYDLEFDRSYPPSLGIGDRLITNAGNAVADWTATIFGAATNPALIINGAAIRFDRDGGLALTAGTSVVIDSRERTILLNGDPDESRYSKANFEDWTWEQVRLQPGNNLLRFEGDVLSEQASVQFCWRSAWL